MTADAPQEEPTTAAAHRRLSINPYSTSPPNMRVPASERKRLIRQEFIEGGSAWAIAKSMGIGVSTVYRYLCDMRTEFDPIDRLRKEFRESSEAEKGTMRRLCLIVSEQSAEDRGGTLDVTLHEVMKKIG